MSTRIVLTDSKVFGRVLDDRSAVVVYIQVIRYGKHCNDRRKLLRRRLSIHRVSENLV